MTELEKHLSGALRSLAEQYEREQKRSARRVSDLSGQVATLRGQVEQLQRHVTYLAADYGKLAGDYRRIADALVLLSKR